MSVGRITTGRVLWPAGANWTTGKREVIVELKPIGPDGNCTGCGAKPTRDTGSCHCLRQITTALAATPRPDPADAPAPDAGLDVERERYTPSTIPSQRELLEKQRPSYHFPGVGDAAAPAPDAGLREALEQISGEASRWLTAPDPTLARRVRAIAVAALSRQAGETKS
jgi:hypothetical protein